MAVTNSNRKYDMIVFGATGFSGKHVLEEIVNTINAGYSESFTWAVSGRSQAKLEQILKEMSDVTGMDLTNTDKIVTDVSDEESLHEMARQCRIVLNTVGPYALYGEAVIKACIQEGTHHIDISAESHNLTQMQILFNEVAEEKGVYVVGSCGFDSENTISTTRPFEPPSSGGSRLFPRAGYGNFRSRLTESPGIPTECGINFLQQNFEGELNSVTSYLYTGSHIWTNRINYGTWTSLLRFYSDFGKLRPLLKRLYPKELPKPKYKPKARLVHRNDTGERGWCIPLPHPDTWAVERSQNYFYLKDKQRPVQFVAYLKQSNFFLTMYVAIGALLLGLLLKCRLVSLMEAFPRLFSGNLISHDGPTRAQMKAFDFSFTLIGNGWDTKLQDPDQDHPSPPCKTMVVKVKGNNPGYGVTCMCLVQAALVILNEKHLMPSTGGVFTPGTAFAKTRIVDRLEKHGLTYTILQ